MGYYTVTATSQCYECPANFYCTTTSSSPTACPINTHSPLFSLHFSYCKSNCAAGYYCETPGIPLSCPEGSYCPDNTNSPIPCLSGTYSGALASKCTNCEIGFACPSSKISDKISCAPGTFSAGNSVKCSSCTSGTYSDAQASKCTDCEPGFACPTSKISDKISCTFGTFASGKSVSCDPCPGGKICTAVGIGADCSQGTYLPAISWGAVCSSCQTATYSGPNALSCNDCEAGFACPTSLLSDKIACSNGKYSLGKSIVCLNCPGGYECTSSTLGAPCAAGKYLPALTYSPCLDTPSGHYSSSGASSYLECETGHYSATEGKSYCDECGVGQYSALSGQSSCNKCSAGYYQDLPGQSSCKECNLGYYQDETGQSTCKLCRQGTYGDAKALPECKACPSDTENTKLGSISISDCAKCPANRLVKGICITCDFRCKDCSDTTPNNCMSCDYSVDGVIKTGPKSCGCKEGYYADLEAKKCIRCPNPLCSSCAPTSIDDTRCLNCTTLPNIEKTEISSIPLLYKCKCSSDTTLKGELCIFNSTCHPLCKDGCSEPNNPNRCMKCKAGPNIASQKVDDHYFSCNCYNDTLLLGDKCGYLDCAASCKGCYAKNNSSSCFDCIANITAIFENDDGLATCQCPNGTYLNNGTCQKPLLNNTCHPLCGGSCVAANDPTKCLKTSNKTNAICKEVGDLLNCSCPKGTYFNEHSICVSSCNSLCQKCIDNNLCEKCRDDIEGSILVNGKCLCDTGKGYITKNEDGNATCSKKLDSAAASGQTAGTTVMSISILSAIFLPGCGGIFWKFQSVAQELVLMSIINVPNVSPSLISLYQGGSFLSYRFFNPLLEILPEDIRGEETYNILEDNAQNHPSLNGKLFIVNIFSSLCFILTSIIAYFISRALSYKFTFFKSLSDSFVFCGVIRCIQSCFVDIVLAGFIQLKYSSLQHSVYFSVNCFAAGFLLLCECLFTAFNAWVALKPINEIYDEKCIQKYGAFYEEVNMYQPLLVTPVLHNVRMILMIGLTVFAADSALLQSSIYFVLTFAGTLWDFSMSPYRGKMLAFQVHIQNSIKFLASLGYVLLCFKYTSGYIISWIYTYEFSLMLISLSGGMLIAITQQLIELYNKLKEYFSSNKLTQVHAISIDILQSDIEQINQ